MNRSIFIRLFSAIWLFSIAQEGFSQDLLWKVGVYNLFDNSEFDRSDIKTSRTMTSTQLQPLIGLGIEEKHRIMAGVDLMKELLINCQLVEFDVSGLKRTAECLEKRIQNYESHGKRLAKKLKGKTPIIYSSTYFKSLANIWKIKINENAKTPAFWNYFPELNHNEMVGFTLPQADFFFLMLKDDKDHPQNKKRFSVMKKMMKKQGMSSEIIAIEGKDLFEKVFATLALGDWTSYYLALEYGIDPTPVEMVEKFKKIIS